MGFRKERGKMKKNPLWDFEVFANKLRMFRGWDITRCRMEWEKIEVRSVVGLRHKGPGMEQGTL